MGLVCREVLYRIVLSVTCGSSDIILVFVQIALVDMMRILRVIFNHVIIINQKENKQ